ncbi:MAG: hypothetical protein AB1765_02970 [Candidatus Hydrogenedentota bacterium]
MTEQEYYYAVYPKIKNCFTYAYYVLGAGAELIRLGWNPNGLLVTVEPKENLYRLISEHGLQVFIPVIGINSDTVLAPFDFEISLTSENYKLYEDKEYQKHFYKKIFVLIKYLEKMFNERGIHYLLDLTPSGGHILFHVKRGTKVFNELKEIGFLEEDLKKAYAHKSDIDYQRKYGVSEDAGFVFSGLGRLSEYIGLKAKKELKEYDGYPITICDSLDKSINYDNSWAGDSAYKRIMRSPFSLHKKNTQKYGKYWQNSLVDILQTVRSENENITIDNMEYLIDCMWDLNLASIHSEQFSGNIPVANDSLCSLIDDYKKSELYEFHKEFDSSLSFSKGEILKKALTDNRLNNDTKNILHYPDPALLQPMWLKSLIHDLVIENGYSPREAACLIRDFYQNNQYHWAGTDWLKYPSETRANFWARTYTAVLLLENGKIRV